MSQPSLFPEPGIAAPGAARHNDPPTSTAAALANPGARGELRCRILELFFENQHRFYNDDELVQALDARWPSDYGHHLPSVVKRKGELVAMGWLEKANFTRLTRRNQPAEVFRLSLAALTIGSIAENIPPKEDTDD